MSGETEQHPSGWSPDLLKQHFDRQLADLSLRIDQQFTDRDLRFQQRFEASEHQLNVVPPVAEQVSKLAVRVDGFEDLMAAKFTTYKVMVDSQAEKVELALTSADKEKASDKEYIREALDARDKLINTLTDRVRELELGQRGVTSTQAGGQQKAVDQRAFIATVVAVAGLVIILAVAVANWASKPTGSQSLRPSVQPMALTLGTQP